MSRTKGVALAIVAVIGAVPVAGWSQIEEIVVTTRKKEESLQDVPIAVSAITSAQIERQGIADLNDIVKNTPSVQFDRAFGPADTRVTIRGLSNTRGRSNVAFLVDNIDVTTENFVTAGSGLLANRRLLTDVERIEIVKGPQSALYGRAAFSGAFNYITKEPGDVVDGSVKLDFAEDGFQEVGVGLGGPISDTVGLRATGFWFEQGGHYVNSISGDDVGGSSGAGGALTAVFRPNDVTKIKVRSEYSKEDYDPLPNVRVGGGWQGSADGGQNIVLAEYPDAMLQHARNMLSIGGTLNGLGFNSSDSLSTGILDFNQYCPQGFTGGAGKGPGFCLPTSFGDANGRLVKHSENPLTGEDFDGTDLETFRTSVIATFDMDGGTLTSYTGFTNFNADDRYDQDWQAETEYRYTPPGGVPTTVQQLPPSPSPSFYNGRIADQLTAGQVASTESSVDQFSQELRFGSKLDGPVQYTLGALFWDETRTLDEFNAITACMPLQKNGKLGIDGSGNFTYPTFTYDSGICDGTQGTVVGWQEYYRQVADNQVPSYWRADTRHWSFYATLDWEFAEDWSLTFENRFISEDFTLLKPNQTTCTSLGFEQVIGQRFLADTSTFEAVCQYNKILTPGEILLNTDTIRTFEASTTSHFSTPKITLNWKPTGDTLLYFFWAEAQKPGGINQLVAGNSPAKLSDDVYDPEKLTAWEFGTKNTFDVLGPFLANASFFFQDYTDKQVTTQVVNDQGILAPRVTNASGAEIWGLELEFTWLPDLVEGLTLNLAYTYLDAEYIDFTDPVTSPQKLAALNSIGKGCSLSYRDIDNNEVAFNDPNARAVVCNVDYSGSKLERTPEHAVALGASYIRPLLDTGLDLLAETNASWQDDRFIDESNTLKFDAYWLVDVRLGLIHPKYEIVAYVDNVFDDDTIRSGGSGPDFGRQVAETAFTAGLGVSHFFGTLPDPRIFGVRMSYKFGEQ